MESKIQVPVSMCFNSETGETKFKYITTTREEFRKAIQQIFAPYFEKGGHRE